MNKSSLKNIEKQTYLLLFKDGTIELLFGSIFLIYALNTWYEMHQFFRPYWLRLLILPVTLVLVILKERIIKPRLGYVSLSKLRRRKNRGLLIFLAIVQILTLAAYLLSVKDIILPEEKTGFFALLTEFILLIGILLSITLVTGYPAFFIAGLVFAFSTPFLIFLNPDLHLSNLRVGIQSFAGFLFFCYGILRLLRFLKTYPKHDKDE